MFRYAIVRPPGNNFAEGLTTADLGRPDHTRALAQHAAYCRALEACGLELIALEPDLRYPDSTFVEDAAIVTERCAVITHPGAPSRQGEEVEIRETLRRFYRDRDIGVIEPPGTLDGGDICEAGEHFLIGISERTNPEGARQLAALLERRGYTSACVDIRGVPGILHLKSGIAYLGEGNLLVWKRLASWPEFERYNRILVEAAEHYAANCVLVNGTVLVPQGFPGVLAGLQGCGYEAQPLDMSEFEKMDGGLSCLSLRF